ncbi:MAG: hypothetical protein E6R03_01755 [Hyphomicrobiaceae bacterium]|nr:MAG: hypothetical protein E6R03_01755 [Hyphomicrobiaceae bacterium]
MKNSERLRHACPKCNAKPGDPCVHYNGSPTDRPHKVRGPGQLDAQLAAEAKRKADREKKSYGPLFQEIAEKEVRTETVEELKLRKRFEAAYAVENKGLLDKANSGLEWIRLRWIKRETAKILGEEVAEKLWSRAIRVYDTKEAYIESVFARALTTTDEIVLCQELRFDPARVRQYNADGRYLVVTESWPPPGFTPPLTRAEYQERFPKFDHRHGSSEDFEPDDDGLFDRLISTLHGSRSAA